MHFSWIIGFLVCFSGVLSADNATAAPGVGTTTEPLAAFIISIKITNRVYNDSLRDHQSLDYKTLREEVEDVFSSTYSHTPSAQYQDISEMTFSNGSVIASSVVLFGTKQINQQAVKNIFVTNYQQHPSTMLDVSINYTADQQPVPVPVPLSLLDNISDSLVSAHSDTAHTTTVNTTNAIDSHTTSSTAVSIPVTTISYSTNSDARTHTSAPNAGHLTHTDSHIYTSATSANHSSFHSFASTDSYNHTTVNATTIGASNASTHSSKDTTVSPQSHFTVHINDSSTHSRTTTFSPPTDSTVTLSTNFTSASSLPSASTRGRVNHTPLGPEEPGSLTAEQGVPGWGLAILVLAAIILFFLMLLIILLLLCWWCWWRQRGFMNVSDPEPIGYYNPDIPMYSTHCTYESHNGKSTDSDSERPPKNRTGIYAVNK